MELIKEGVYASTVSNLPNLFAGLSERQCREYVNAMERSPEYSGGVIRPTQKTSLVVIETFVEYLRHMERTRFE